MQTKGQAIIVVSTLQRAWADLETAIIAAARQAADPEVSRLLNEAQDLVTQAQQTQYGTTWAQYGRNEADEVQERGIVRSQLLRPSR